ncbi:hypothetical protein JHK84_049555 [Glycine max]|nr:hypothetical protein JHK84_049555 [Glycine max]
MFFFFFPPFPLSLSSHYKPLSISHSSTHKPITITIHHFPFFPSSSHGDPTTTVEVQVPHRSGTPRVPLGLLRAPLRSEVPQHPRLFLATVSLHCAFSRPRSLLRQDANFAQLRRFSSQTRRGAPRLRRRPPPRPAARRPQVRLEAPI